METQKDGPKLGFNWRDPSTYSEAHGKSLLELVKEVESLESQLKESQQMVASLVEANTSIAEVYINMGCALDCEKATLEFKIQEVDRLIKEVKTQRKELDNKDKLIKEYSSTITGNDKTSSEKSKTIDELTKLVTSQQNELYDKEKSIMAYGLQMLGRDATSSEMSRTIRELTKELCEKDRLLKQYTPKPDPEITISSEDEYDEYDEEFARAQRRAMRVNIGSTQEEFHGMVTIGSSVGQFKQSNDTVAKLDELIKEKDEEINRLRTLVESHESTIGFLTQRVQELTHNWDQEKIARIGWIKEHTRLLESTQSQQKEQQKKFDDKETYWFCKSVEQKEALGEKNKLINELQVSVANLSSTIKSQESMIAELKQTVEKYQPGDDQSTLQMLITISEKILPIIHDDVIANTDALISVVKRMISLKGNHFAIKILQDARYLLINFIGKHGSVSEITKAILNLTNYIQHYEKDMNRC